jgi:ABC-type branched-subunit amino acid transport system substrate-binding protein
LKHIQSPWISALALYVLFFMFCPCFAQTTNPRTLLEEGLILYKNGHYDEAKIKFDAVTDIPQPNAFLSISYIMLAKSGIQMSEYQRSIEYATIQLRAFPQSKYVCDAHLVQAIACAKLANFSEALVQLAWALETSSSKELTVQCRELALKILPHNVEIARIQQLYQENTWKNARPYLLYWLAVLHYLNNDKSKSDDLLKEVIKSRPDGQLMEMARNFTPPVKITPSQKIKIGVIVPITGYFGAEASDFLRGLAFAIKERKNENPQILLSVNDSKGTNVGAVQAALDFIDKKVDVLFGELEDERSTMIAGVMANTDIPLIVPITTENGISSIGKNIFQSNSDLEMRGSALAKYAIEELHMRTFATLAPADEYGHSLTDAFTNTVDQMGGVIVSQQWYYTGTHDFKNQFDAIRNAGFRYAYRDSLIFQGLSIQTTKIDSLFRIRDRKVKLNSDDEEGLLETTDIAITSIDGFFCPVYEEDVSLIAPQLALYNLQSRPLGGDYWSNKEVLKKERTYINGMVFFTGNYISELDILYRNFENKFRTLTKKTPGVMAIYGYNIMSFVLEAIDAGNVTGKDIAHYLENVKLYSGIGGNISFYESNHVNNAVNILQFQDGNIIILKQ